MCLVTDWCCCRGGETCGPAARRTASSPRRARWGVPPDRSPGKRDHVRAAADKRGGVWLDKSTHSLAPSNIDCIPSTVQEMNIRVLLFSGCPVRFHQCDLYTKLVSGVRHSMIGSQHRKIAAVGRSKTQCIQGPKRGLVRRHPLSSPNVLVLFNRHDLVQSPSHMCAEEILHAFGIVGRQLSSPRLFRQRRMQLDIGEPTDDRRAEPTEMLFCLLTQRFRTVICSQDTGINVSGQYLSSSRRRCTFSRSGAPSTCSSSLHSLRDGSVFPSVPSVG